MLPFGAPKNPRENWLNLFPSPYHHDPKWTSFRATRDNLSMLQRMSLLKTVEVHRGCVNTICWDDSGNYLLSGSDDHRLIITEPYTKKVNADVLTSHKANIFSAKFLPGSSIRKIVSCAGDGNIIFTDLTRVAETRLNSFNCHSGTTYEILTVPNDPNSFLSCGEDGTVRWFDLRTKDKCRKQACTDDILINLSVAVTSMTMNQHLPYYLAVGSSDSSVRIFDRRMLCAKSSRCKAGLVSRFLLPDMEGKKRRITAIDYRPDGQEILVSFSSDYIYIFDPNDNDDFRKTKLCVGQRPEGTMPRPRARERSPPPMKRLRLRGDWSDTGPNARPDLRSPEPSNQTEPNQSINQEEAQLLETAEQRRRDSRQMNVNLMQRMTDALSRMLNDPSTRMAMRNLNEQRSENDQRTRAPNDAGSGSGWGADLRPSHSNWNDSSNPGDNAIGRTIDSIQDSISEMREEFLDRHNSEPEVNLQYRSRGMDTSSISIERSSVPNLLHQNASESRMTLPGPRQLTTDQGNPGTNPVTGARQRRRGVSGPSSESLAMSTPQPSQSSSNSAGAESCFSDDDCCEFEVDDSTLEVTACRLVNQPRSLQKFTGHRNARTMIKEATWWGNNFVLSGSDCGHIFGWERSSGKLVLLLEADRHVVNCIQPHPNEPLIASSGIDYDVKLWAPSGSGNEDSHFDESRASELTRMNEIMLEETRDTITVPATLMIRMLASLNQIRRAGRLIPRNLERPEENQEDTNQDSGE